MTTLPAHPGADAVLDALDPEQREVAAHPSGPMCVLAGAGTGKTRAITHRIAYGVLSGVYQPQRVLAVTFTARAAGEMRTRLRDLGVGGVQARTFHAAALRQLHYFWPQAVGGASPEVMPHKVSAVAEAAGRLRLRLDAAALRDVASEIEWSKVSLLTPDTYAAAVATQRREPPAGLDPTATARLVAAYEEVKTERGMIDFEDVLLLMVGILREHDEVARAVRSQYRHFVVDEYQDVNRLQQTLLELWLGERRDLCVVGDPAQTIYSFTGASPEHLLGFRARHPDARTVELVRNYRSTPQVVGLANLVLRGPGGQRRSGSVELRAQRPDGPAPELVVADNDPDEAATVAGRIAALVEAGHPASEIAVLYRTNGQSESFESALAERGIPYLVRGGERFFSRKEVRDAIVLMRGAARSDDGTVPLPDLARDVLMGAGWSRQAPTGGASRERWESLSALASLADDLHALDPEARLPALVRELEERAAAQHAPTVQGVTLASFHAAKGLEWDTVFLVGCSDGLLPITMADTPEAIEEERRLLYVGVTRARERLVMSYAGARTPGAKPTRRPSRFLDGTAAVLGQAARSQPKRRQAAAGAGRVKAPVRTTCRGCGVDLRTAKERTIGRCATCPPTMDERLFEALREWRLETAREADVPAFVVFTDATLTAVAERAPADVASLAGITGVGPAKLERYGAAVLDLVRKFSDAR
jgi:ATP-dependent DNA helicase UvrD/PcrA